MLPIKGLEKTSFVDYSPYTVSTIFIGGCNFRCPFCHNPSLVEPGTSVNLPVEQIIEFAKSRKKWIDGVCITGGEPTLYPDLIDFIERLKKESFLVKLDTNGSNPDLLQELCSKSLVDYIAMDIKNSIDKYDKTAGGPVDIDKIKKSVDIIRNSGIDHEFRTTVVPIFHTKDDIRKIAEWLSGSRRFVIQKFRSDVKLLDTDLEGQSSFSSEELEEFGNILKASVDEVKIKN